MKIFCDDGSTNVKLAWFEGKTLKSAVSVNSFRHNWKVEGGNDSNLLIVFYVQIMPDDFVMQLHRF